ncbi:MAG: type IV pilus modification protein PilV [Xanthomonadales bacterium]|nr:hypothetical protein [Xanthomonadales bacterium]MCC6593078.1 type IV pilus modification protein PilV [Xanthomonadales bacterium]
MHRTRSQRGFTLIEVMVALLIFSVGLMGMAGLMVLSVKTNQSAYLRTQASFLAQSMADRIMVNRALVTSYVGTYNASTAAASDPCTSGATCSPAQMVLRDQALWSQQMVAFLPNPTARVACNGAVLGNAAQAGASPFNGLCTLTIEWDESTLTRGTLSATPAAATANRQMFAWVFQP